jgi:hypothetical protein
VFRNTFRYGEVHKKHDESSDSDLDHDDNDDDTNLDLNKADEVVLDGECHNTKVIIEVAAFHIMQATSVIGRYKHGRMKRLDHVLLSSDTMHVPES